MRPPTARSRGFPQSRTPESVDDVLCKPGFLGGLGVTGGPMTGKSARLVKVAAVACWLTAGAVIAWAWARGDAAEVRRLLAMVAVAAGAALTVGATVLHCLPPRLVAWMAGYRSAVMDVSQDIEVARRRRSFRSVE